MLVQPIVIILKKNTFISLISLVFLIALSLSACSFFSREMGIAFIPELMAPNGEIYDSTPTYTWSAVVEADEYQIQVLEGEDLIFNKTLTAERACSGDICSLVLSSALRDADHRWRVRALVGEDWQEYSDYLDFSFAPEKSLLEMHSYNLEDCISSWWTFPLAKRYTGLRDKTYLGYTDSQGYSGVASIDNNSGQVIKTRLRKNSSADDHNSVAVDILPDGRIIAAYSGGHIKTNQMFVRISSKAENIEEFDDPVVIEAGKATTYAQIFQKSGMIWLFFRTGREEESGWSYSYSDDGSVWSEPLEIVSGGMQYYLKISDTTDNDLLRMVMYSNPNAEDTNIRLGFFNTSTREIQRADGTVLGREQISRDLFPVIISNEQGRNCRLLDVAVTEAARTVVAYAVFSDAADAEYKVAYFTGQLDVIPIVAAGDAFYTKSVYVGGMVFGRDENTLYLSRENNGRWFIEEWQTADQRSFVRITTIHTSDTGMVAIRPVVELDGNRLFWQEGFYNSESYSDFYTDYRYAMIDKPE